MDLHYIRDLFDCLDLEEERPPDAPVNAPYILAPARAYLREHARVLVLDEPTSALDARAEVDVYRQFLDLSQIKDSCQRALDSGDIRSDLLCFKSRLHLVIL